MRNTSKLLASLFMIVFLASCNKKPVAAFGFSTTVPLVDEDITFNNTSTNGETYSWDFGDGTSSELQSPKKSYAVEGTYNVTLTTYASNGRKWNKTSQDIVVLHPEAMYSGDMNAIFTRLLHGVNGAVYGYGYSGTISGGTVTRVYEAKVGRYSGSVTLQEMKCEIGTVTYPDTYTLAQSHPVFHSAISVKTYNYSAAAANGVRLSYVDEFGMTWSTDAGTGSQSGSTFVCTYTNDTSNGGYEAEYMKAHFKCNLYNGLGQSIVVDNGILELIFANKP